MTTTAFEQISHADFLRLTLEAFTRQGYAVEQSRAADADAVLLNKNGARIGILCKKYRSAIIGRPVLQQFHKAMLQLRCTEGYLITTTDCSPEAHEFATGKGIVLYDRERTTELLRTAFGDEFIGSGRIPDLGTTARTAPPAARAMSSAASYEKVAVSDLKKTPEPGEPLEPVPASKSAQASEPAPSPEPEIAPEPGHAPLTETVKKELPEEHQDAQAAGPSGIAEGGPSEHTTIIVCLECNKNLQVPIDQGVITVTCPECGMRRIYQPELDSAGELKTKTVIACKACSQKLNVPTNRGQLNVRCPQCKAAWVFTP